VAIERKSGGWTLSVGSESSIPADQSVAEQAASQAQALRLVGKIDTTPLDLSAFGLDKPAYICTFILANTRSAIFKIGNPTPIGNGYYVQQADGTVVIVDKAGIDSLLNLLKQPPYMFTPTPSPAPVTETPTPAPTSDETSLPGTEVPTVTATP
jgi:hypothetical protein